MSLCWPIFIITVFFFNVLKHLTQFFYLNIIIHWIIHSTDWHSLVQKEFLPIYFPFRGLCMRANPSSVCSSTQRSAQGQRTLRYVGKMRSITDLRKKGFLKIRNVFICIYMRTQETKIITLDDPGTEHSRRVLWYIHIVLKFPHEYRTGNFYHFFNLK